MYWCPITFVVSLTVPVKSDIFVNVLVICELGTSSPSTYTDISSVVTLSLTSKYLSITLNIIVSVFAVESFAKDTFSIFGFIKSTCPSVNSCFWLLLVYWSVIVPAATWILVVPLHSKNCFPVCFVASSQSDNVNVYLTPYCTLAPFLVSVNGVAALKDFFTFAVVVTSSPSIITLILFVVRLLLA